MNREDFFRLIFQLKNSDEKIRVLTKKVDGNKTKSYFFQSVPELKLFLNNIISKKMHVWLNPAFVKGNGTSGKISDISATGCLWADIDFEDGISDKVVYEKIKDFEKKCPLKPSIVVISGNKGFHAYWLLKKRLGFEELRESEKYWTNYLKKEICENVKCDVIASGGITKAKDIQFLQNLRQPNLLGAIVGKALYEGKVTLRQLTVIGDIYVDECE